MRGCLVVGYTEGFEEKLGPYISLVLVTVFQGSGQKAYRGC